MEIYEYSIMFVVLFFIISKTDIDTRTLISLVIVSGIVYYYYQKNLDKEQKFKDKLKSQVVGKHNFSKYKNIINENEFLNIFNDIRDLKKYNKKTIEESFKYFDNFFQLINDLKKGLKYSHHSIEVADQERTKGLNILTSLVVNLPISERSLYEEKLNKNIDNIEKITYKYLKEAVNQNNSNTIKDYNITKKIMDIDSPKGTDPYFNKNLDIY